MPPETEKDLTAEEAVSEDLEVAEEAVGASGKVKVKFEIYGEEMIEKKVKSSGNSGRVYLPPNWVGHHVKIIRID
jgi:putative transposon-encoded protein